MNQKSTSEEKIKAIILSKIVKELIYSSGGDVYRLKGVIEEEDEEKKYEEKRRKKKLREIVKDKEHEREGKKKEPDLKDIIREKGRTPFAESRPRIQRNIHETESLPNKKEPELEKDLGKKTPEEKKEINFKPLPKPRTPGVKNVPPQKRVLRIPAPRLPKRFSYLRPTPKNVNIELGKLNSLINDPGVRAIECQGPNTGIFVSGSMGRKKTNIVLSNDEINQIIDKFSEETKIPAGEGVYRVVAGNLIFSAVISSVTNKRFIIRKMAPQKQPPR